MTVLPLLPKDSFWYKDPDMLGIAKTQNHWPNLAERMYEIGSKENELLNQFAAAYLQQTKIPPDEAMLVRQITGNQVTWHFQRREPDTEVGGL